MPSSPTISKVQQKAIQKADTLIEALGWIRKFRDTTTVIKLGGSVVEHPDSLRHLLLDIVFMSTLGMRVVVVHGGGKAISRAMDSAGIQPRFVQGRRYTDQATLDIVEKVLATELNHDLTAKIEEYGGRAMSLNFLSTNVLYGEKLCLEGPDGEPLDLGHVGEVTRVDRLTIDNLSYAGQVPVIPSMAITASGEKLNVNADTAATAVAAAIGAEKLVVLSDIPGVLRDVNDPESLIHSLTATEARRHDLVGNDPEDRGLPDHARTGREEDSHHRRPAASFASSRNLHHQRRRHGTCPRRRHQHVRPRRARRGGLCPVV